MQLILSKTLKVENRDISHVSQTARWVSGAITISNLCFEPRLDLDLFTVAS